MRYFLGYKRFFLLSTVCRSMLGSGESFLEDWSWTDIIPLQIRFIRLCQRGLPPMHYVLERRLTTFYKK